jgi:N-acetylglutamate synthase-like GNAT family acetyltransferase
VVVAAVTRPRDLQMFRPYADEVPWELLESAGANADALSAVLELDLVRVAKLDGRVVGGYGIRPLSPTSYELVALAIAEGWRGKGFGRWLVGHAIGLAESRGGREIVVRGRGHASFLRRFGFEPAEDGLVLALIPE